MRKSLSLRVREAVRRGIESCLSDSSYKALRHALAFYFSIAILNLGLEVSWMYNRISINVMGTHYGLGILYVSLVLTTNDPIM